MKGYHEIRIILCGNPRPIRQGNFSVVRSGQIYLYPFELLKRLLHGLGGEQRQMLFHVGTENSPFIATSGPTMPGIYHDNHRIPRRGRLRPCRRTAQSSEKEKGGAEGGQYFLTKIVSFHFPFSPASYITSEVSAEIPPTQNKNIYTP